MGYFDKVCPVCGRSFSAAGIVEHVAIHIHHEPVPPEAPDRPRQFVYEFRPSSFTGLRDYLAETAEKDRQRSESRKASLGNAVEAQVEALTAGLDWHGGAEMPLPEPDLTSYRDAFASARANCRHDNAIETLHEREWVCDDCSRVIGRDEMRRARGWWGA